MREVHSIAEQLGWIFRSDRRHHYGTIAPRTAMPRPACTAFRRHAPKRRAVLEHQIVDAYVAEDCEWRVHQTGDPDRIVVNSTTWVL